MLDIAAKEAGTAESARATFQSAFEQLRSSLDTLNDQIIAESNGASAQARDAASKAQLLLIALSIVGDRGCGFLRELTGAPVRRGSTIVGKALGGAVVATVQGMLVMAFAGLVDIPYHPVMIVLVTFEVFLLSFTLCLDNTIISSFVFVQGSTPWPVYVFSSVKSSLRPEIASISTLMFIVTVLAIALVAVVLRRGGDSSTNIAATMTGTK